MLEPDGENFIHHEAVATVFDPSDAQYPLKMFAQRTFIEKGQPIDRFGSKDGHHWTFINTALNCCSKTHNQPDSDEFEWGPEAPQLLELPNGDVLLMATCFLKGEVTRHRQRLFFALYDGRTFLDDPLGSLREIFEPPLDPELDGVLNGENGHGHMHLLLENGRWYLSVLYHARTGPRIELDYWRLMAVRFDLTPLLDGRPGTIRLPRTLRGAG